MKKITLHYNTRLLSGVIFVSAKAHNTNRLLLNRKKQKEERDENSNMCRASD